jgi:mRNA interferase MazF
MGVVVERFDVFLVTLDPARGAEIQKTRPCLVISPNEMNRHIRTVLIAPMTTRTRNYPSRVPCVFHGKSGQVVLDQIRAVDKARLVTRLGRLDEATQSAVLEVLGRMFAR